MGDILGPGFFIKPRYRHEVLIGNWYEDRALHDPSFLNSTMPTHKPAASIDSVVKDEVRPTSASNTGAIVNNGQQSQAGLDRSMNNNETNKQQLNGKDSSVSRDDPMRGYYATTYKRSYGPRPGYIHSDSYPKADDFMTRRKAALKPDQIEGSSEALEDGEKASECLRCEQLAKTSRENSGCLRCTQLAGL